MTSTPDIDKLRYDLDEFLEEFARMLLAPQRYFIERVEDRFTVPSPQAFFTQTVMSIRETGRLGVLITEILQVLRNERLDLDVAATLARGAVARVGKEA